MIIDTNTETWGISGKKQNLFTANNMSHPTNTIILENLAEENPNLSEDEIMELFYNLPQP